MAKRQDQDGIYEREDSPYLWSSYTDISGKRVRRSTRILKARGAEGRREAEALLSKWKSEVFQERMWGRAPEDKKPAYTFDDVMLAYFRGQVPKQLGGVKRAKSTVKPVYEYFTGRVMRDIGDSDVKAYIRQRQEQGKGPGTINKEVGIFSAACNYARDELDWDIPNPAARKKITEPEGIVRWISVGDANRLIKAAGENCWARHLPDVIQLALNTGCRIGQLLGLRWESVDLKQNLIFVRHAKGRTKKIRIQSVPLNESAREAILSRARFRAENCPDNPWVFCRASGKPIKSVKRSFKTACKNAEIENYRIHDQRHTLASWMIMKGIALAEVRDMLGHSTIKMTERYAHLHPENIRAAAEKIKGVSRSSHAAGGREILDKEERYVGP
jgi:integrase